MLPGVPFQVDEVLTPETSRQYFHALVEALGRLDRSGATVTSLKIERGVLSIFSDRAPTICLHVRPCCAGCD